MSAVFCLLLSSSALAQPLYQLVGEARLSLLFWDVYDARLFTPTGKFSGIQPPLLLRLDYLRDIPASELIEATREELQKVAPTLPEKRMEKQLSELASFWPDIKKGDQLSFELGDQQGRFYFNEQPIGQTDDLAFAKGFLAIWLADNSSYPTLSRQLRGQP